MKKRFGLTVFCFLSVTISTSAPAAIHQAEPVVIRFSHVVEENTPKGFGAQRFKELAEQRLPGRVLVKIYPRSEKFTDEQALIGLLLGDVQLVAPSLSKFCKFSKDLHVFDIPFMFENVREVHEIDPEIVAGAKKSK